MPNNRFYSIFYSYVKNVKLDIRLISNFQMIQILLSVRLISCNMKILVAEIKIFRL